MTAPYPALCHYQSVTHYSPHTGFEPWKNLNSHDYAKYIYKQYSLVEVKNGNPGCWGDWGSTAPGAGPDNVFAVLDFHQDYVLIKGVDLFLHGNDQAVLQEDAPPVFVWSRYLRKHTQHVTPLLLNWHHYLERQPNQFLQEIRPNAVINSFQIVQTPFAHDSWHMILDAYAYAKFVYKWGEIVQFGRGSQDEMGNWGFQGFIGGNANFVNQRSVVLSKKESFVLIQKAIVINGAIGLDSFHDPVWVWSRYLRIQTGLRHPRKLDWYHPWEPQQGLPPPNGYIYIRRPLNDEE